MAVVLLASWSSFWQLLIRFDSPVSPPTTDGCSGSWILMMATDALMDGNPHIRLTFTSRSWCCARFCHLHLLSGRVGGVNSAIVVVFLWLWLRWFCCFGMVCAFLTFDDGRTAKFSFPGLDFGFEIEKWKSVFYVYVNQSCSIRYVYEIRSQHLYRIMVYSNTF